MSTANGVKKLLQKVLVGVVEAGGYDAQLSKVIII